MKIGDRVGPWLLAERIDQGGNAEVWKATKDDDDEVFAALKILKTRRRDSEPYKRFCDEIELLKKLGERPGILPLLDSYLPNHPSKSEPAWLAMPVAQGLAEFLGDQPDLVQVVTALAFVADTLATLHEESIAHRDIKPQNLFWYNGHGTVGDFGLVDFPGKEELTGTERAVGPRNFLPPEMLSHPDTTNGHQVDVYELAKTLWVFATGQRWPPPGEQRLDTPQVLVSAYTSHSKVYLLDRLIERATKHDPGTRPTMKEMANELDAWLKPSPQAPLIVNLADPGARVQAVIAPAKRAQEEEQHRRQLFGEVLERMREGLLTLNPLIEQTGATTGPPVNATQFGRALANQVEGLGMEPVWRQDTCLVSSYLGKGVLYVGLVCALFPDENVLLYAGASFSRSPTTVEAQILWRSSPKLAHLGTATELKATEELCIELTEALPEVLQRVIHTYVL